MKVILSRKGFDSQYGGSPSPILPDGGIVSIPIPDNRDQIHYSDLGFDDNNNYEDLLKQLGIYKRYLSRICHLDPDLCKHVYKRKSGWKPIFGQIDTSQSHLYNENVGKGDLFLFFGSFRKTIIVNKKLTFDENSPEIHAIFGYLQIEKAMKENFPEWMKYHPHASATFRLNNISNTIYVSRDTVTWDNRIPGAGSLRFHKGLVLTKEGCSKSKWDLDPNIFKDVKISYHPKPWTNGYFQSTAKGQEFVIQDNEKVEEWAKSLIEKGN